MQQVLPLALELPTVTEETGLPAVTDAQPPVLPFVPLLSQLPLVVATMCLGGHPLPAAIQSQIFQFFTVSELYPLSRCSHLGDEFVGGYLRNLRSAMLLQDGPCTNRQWTGQMIWSLSALKAYARNLSSLQVSKEMQHTVLVHETSLEMIANFQADIVALNRLTFRKIITTASLKNKRLLEELLECPKLERFNPHATNLTADELASFCRLAIHKLGHQLLSWGYLHTQHIAVDGPGVCDTLVDEILAAGSPLVELTIDSVTTNAAQLISNLTTIECLDIGIQTTKDSYRSMIPVIANLARSLTSLSALELSFDCIAPIDVDNAGDNSVEQITSWEFPASLTCIEINIDVDFEDIDDDFAFRYLPPLILAPRLIEWNGPISFSGFAQLLKSCPLLEVVKGDVGCRHEEDDEKKSVSLYDAGVKAIADAFDHGYGSHLRKFDMQTRAPPWPQFVLHSMIACCQSLIHISLAVDIHHPFEPILRLLSSLPKLHVIRLAGSDIIRSSTIVATSNDTRIHFPQLWVLSLVACDDQFLNDIDAPELNDLRLFSDTCNIASFDSILRTFPLLKELRVTDICVSWNKATGKPILLLSPFSHVPCHLSYLAMRGDKMSTSMVENLLMRSPKIQRITLSKTSAQIMSRIIAKHRDSSAPNRGVQDTQTTETKDVKRISTFKQLDRPLWPLLNKLHIKPEVAPLVDPEIQPLVDPELLLCVEATIELMKSLIYGIPSLTRLELELCHRTDEKNAIRRAFTPPNDTLDIVIH